MLPALSFEGTNDGNSLKGNTNPYLRAIDGVNTHDDGYPLIIAGGTTTQLVRPPLPLLHKSI